MSFSFNWAGVTVPQGQRRDTMDRAVQAAGSLGQAARGYWRHKADTEYGDMLKDYREGGSSGKAESLKAELQMLRQRNAEIAAQLGL